MLVNRSYIEREIFYTIYLNGSWTAAVNCVNQGIVPIEMLCTNEDIANICMKTTTTCKNRTLYNTFSNCKCLFQIILHLIMLIPLKI